MKRIRNLNPVTIHYITLVLILVSGALAMSLLKGARSMQLLVGMVVTAAYVAWGLLHHAIEGDLYPKVVVEYVIIGAIACVILLTFVGF